MSVLARYCSSRRRRPTSSRRPRRLWWSCLCTFRCSVRSAIRLVSIATCTSGEPVSLSAVAYSVMILVLVSWSSAIFSVILCWWFCVADETESSHPRRRAGKRDRCRVLRRRVKLTSRSREQRAGLLHVIPDLRDQRLDALVGALFSQVGDEVEADPFAVQVTGEIQHVRLDP